MRMPISRGSAMPAPPERPDPLPSHAERRWLPYAPEQLYDLVADIERYPEFLPWCAGARIRSRDGNLVTADLVIGFKLYRERFTSRVAFDRPRAIHVQYTEGPFRSMQNEWRFEPGEQGGCVIDFQVAFEVRSKLLGSMVELVFQEAVRRMVGAFEARARKLYGAIAENQVPVA